MSLENNVNTINNYTPDEIQNMTDYKLACEWIRITGYKELYCTHCKKYKPISKYYIESIRKRCKKQGLNNYTDPPKTCDKQQKINSLCNPINNYVYPDLRKNELSIDQINKLQNSREKDLSKVGIKTKPNKYKVTQPTTQPTTTKPTKPTKLIVIKIIVVKDDDLDIIV